MDPLKIWRVIAVSNPPNCQNWTNFVRFSTISKIKTVQQLVTDYNSLN